MDSFKKNIELPPNDLLLICDKCDTSEWTIRCEGVVDYCKCGTMKREASDMEYALSEKK